MTAASHLHGIKLNCVGEVVLKIDGFGNFRKTILPAICTHKTRLNFNFEIAL
jgi:hypothetical protein